MSDTPDTTPASPTPADAEGSPYLWDRSAPVDPEIAALERALAPLRAQASSLNVNIARPPRSRLSFGRLAAVAAIISVGLALWFMWPSGRQIRRIGPWQVVAPSGAHIERITYSNRPQGHAFEIRASADQPVELRTSAGSTVRVEAGSIVTVYDGSGGIDFSDDGLLREGHERHSPMTVTWALSEVANLEIGAEFVCLPGTSATVDADGIRVSAGEAYQLMYISKTAPVHVRLLAGMRTHPSAPPDAPVTAHASDNLISALTRFVEAKRKQAPPELSLDLLRAILAETTVDDAATLWNLRFASRYPLSDEESEYVDNRLGQLLNQWPAVMKMSKEPPSSSIFAEDWWRIIKSAAVARERSASDKVAQDETLKSKHDGVKRGVPPAQPDLSDSKDSGQKASQPPRFKGK